MCENNGGEERFYIKDENSDDRKMLKDLQFCGFKEFNILFFFLFLLVYGLRVFFCVLLVSKILMCVLINL